HRARRLQEERCGKLVESHEEGGQPCGEDRKPTLRRANLPEPSPATRSVQSGGFELLERDGTEGKPSNKKRRRQGSNGLAQDRSGDCMVNPSQRQIWTVEDMDETDS